MNTLPALFQSSLVTYVPAFVVAAFALLLIPSLLVPGARPEAAAKAIASYFMKAVGLLLIAISAMQLTYNAVAQEAFAPESLTGLLVVFVVGLGIMIHESKAVAMIDDASVHVVRAVFTHTCEVIGALIALFSGLSLITMFLMTEQITDWQMPVTLLMLGLVLMLSSSTHMYAKYHKTKKTARKR